jgi:hypothetical protein
MERQARWNSRREKAWCAIAMASWLAASCGEHRAPKASDASVASDGSGGNAGGEAAAGATGGNTAPHPGQDGGAACSAQAGAGHGGDDGGSQAGTGGSTSNDAGRTEACPSAITTRAEWLRSADIATDVPPREDLAILVPRPSGGAVVGYLGSEEKLHIVPLDANDTRAGDELVLDRQINWFASVVAHDDGVAALAFNKLDWWPSPSKPNKVYFARWNAAGALVTDVELAHDYSGFYHAGKLVFSGEHYVAYYPINSDHDGEDGGHEGDNLLLIDGGGQRLEGGWGWGCSHSGDQRVFAQGDKLGAICDSDTYPQKGIIFMNSKLIHPQPDATGGFGHVELGELLAVPGGYVLIFTTAIEGLDASNNPIMRRGNQWDVALALFDDQGTVTSLRFLTSTEARETKPHVALYNDDLFVMYGTVQPDGSETFTALVQTFSGKTVIEPERLNIDIKRHDQIVSFSGGDVGWAVPRAEGGIRVYRVRAECE